MNRSIDILITLNAVMSPTHAPPKGKSGGLTSTHGKFLSYRLHAEHQMLIQLQDVTTSFFLPRDVPQQEKGAATSVGASPNIPAATLALKRKMNCALTEA